MAGAVAASGRGVVLAEMEGHPSGVPGGHPVVPFRVERLGALFRGLRAHGVEEVAMAGILHRPDFDPRRFDLKTLRLVPRIFRGLKAGDDALLRLVIAIFEENGFRIRGAHEFLPDFVAPKGPMTRSAPSASQLGDAARGRAILAAQIGPRLLDRAGRQAVEHPGQALLRIADQRLLQPGGLALHQPRQIGAAARHALQQIARRAGIGQLGEDIRRPCGIMRARMAADQVGQGHGGPPAAGVRAQE
ncbi:UDP-2,3-diacylglucosamine diphosphatase LpxI [Mangrovicoccus ximenensis]|uniref:UDP-2,3-diacylglucosamine diphosphatase LpxI n=1 Tax=Mangrovicoccus ximenensis TaxID=1911570 RepID=UPI000D3D9C8D|nr:UDP-2,3-diacylglucosamine diphosphatase LpxI [Mangrovicoccus ximenensis]